MSSTLKPLEQAERCLAKAEAIRLRRIDGEILLTGPALPLLFAHAANKVRAAGEPALAARIEAAKKQDGQPELDLRHAVKALIAARALPAREAA